MKRIWLPLWILNTLLIGGGYGCGQADSSDRLFQLISPAASGIDFTNTISDSDSFNVLNFHYLYNGGGVGVGDMDLDGWPDLVFTGNQVPSRLYLNQQGLRFKDISEASGFSPQGWVTGVSIVDLNADGLPDIYLSVGGKHCPVGCENQLFLHQGLDDKGMPRFKEVARDYGLNDSLYTQQALFFDYDLDGDLDVYLLHNLTDKRDKNAPSAKRMIGRASFDQLLENRGSGTFVDVSEAKGIHFPGYGLGICLEDFNRDGRPDIYVANDFLSDDLLFLNLGSRDGVHQGFEEVSRQYLRHTSYNAMGVDVADLSQDGWPEIYTLDMMPYTNQRQKSMLGYMNYDKFLLSLRQGYHPQFVRNTLQVHQGIRAGEVLPFSEQGYASGLHQTDWSWTPLLADFDLDGDRDVFVSNGYGKDITDLDFINYSFNRSPFGTPETQQKELYGVIQQMESILLPNFLFENQGNLQFQDRRGQWFETPPSLSNGAAYADLDRDGDLELIINNIHGPAFLYENQGAQQEDVHYLSLSFAGEAAYGAGIGTRIHVWAGGREQTYYHAPVRGYLSTVEAKAHFGLGSSAKVDSIYLISAYGTGKKWYEVAANQTLEVDFASLSPWQEARLHGAGSWMEEKEIASGWEHEENTYQDFDAQPLLMAQHSQLGPCLARGDIHPAPGEELFVGGAKGEAGNIFGWQEGKLSLLQLLEAPEHEDADASFGDLDGDGHLDLYVVSGGTEMPASRQGFYQDRIYLNDGEGNLSLAPTYAPPATQSGGTVALSDIDHDGDLDIFVGGRLIPQKYPAPPQSQLWLQENGQWVAGNRRFALPENMGMISEALWSDYNGDGWADLVVVGEWNVLQIYENQAGTGFKRVAIPQAATGLWQGVQAADLDRDGDLDYLMGNLGTNSRLKASPEQPLYLYTGDFDGNGSPDPLIGMYQQATEGDLRLYPLHARDDVVGQLVKLKNTYPDYASFGQTEFLRMLNQPESDQLNQITSLRSGWMENLGDAGFQFHAWPRAAQMGPVRGMLAADLNGDGPLEILLCGNDMSGEKTHGWHDAFSGLVMSANEAGEYISLSPQQSGFFFPGDGRSLIRLKDEAGESWYIGGQNNGPLKGWQTKPVGNSELSGWVQK